MAESNFDPEIEAMLLNKALHADETTFNLIIGVGKRSLDQRLQIEREYNKMSGDLKKDLEKKLSGNFLKLTLALFYNKPERDARFLNQAMVGLGTDEECLTEILTTRSNKEIQAIKTTYNEIFGHALEDDIKGDTSGYFKSFLDLLLKGSRDDSIPTNQDLAEKEAKELYNAGELKWGTDENRFIIIFTQRNFPQLVATFKQYEKISDKTMTEAVNSEFSGDIRNALVAVIEIARNVSAYFATRLHKVMYECGTVDNDGLIRIAVTQEDHMQSIKQEYSRLYETSLDESIKDVTEGDYGRMLVAVTGKHDK